MGPTSHLLGPTEDPPSQTRDDPKTTEDTWSLLPNLLLWMIMDKLEFFDNMKLHAVCRDWRSASACYPKSLQSVGDGLPWIMQRSKDFKSGTREFVRVIRKEKFTVDLPEFCEAKVLFSNRGWILMQQRRSSISFFLVNFFTNCKMKLPDMEATQGGYCGSFSLVDGYPNRIVLVNVGCATQVHFMVACPGDEAWTKHSYFGQMIRFKGGLRLLILEQNVYCLDVVANMITYNLSNHLWKQVLESENGNPFLRNYVMEHEGKMVKVVPSDTRYSSFTFSRYNDADASWERLSFDNVKDTSWFLSIHRGCFSAKNKGLKVYMLRPKRREMEFAIHSHDVLVYDLVEASTTTLQLSYPICDSAYWVNIG